MDASTRPLDIGQPSADTAVGSAIPRTETDRMFESRDVSDILARAVKAVEDANVPPDLKAAAFERAVDLLARRSAVPSLADTESRAGATLDRAEGGAAPAAASTMDRLATRLRLQRDVIEQVYTESGDGLMITVDPGRLARSRSAGAREVALLVAAAAQAVSDEPTPADAIRIAAAEYDKLDAPNHAATLGAMKGTFLIAGPPRAKTFKLTKPGWVAAATLVAKLGGSDKAAV